MADRPLPDQLPADLPEDWESGQIIAPSGPDVGLSEQHGYNYLMKQVNAAQRAVNTVNEGFDSISGKRACRFVIGASAAGWTQADCDYLCDGTDDQAEFEEAIEALIKRGGGEIAVLSGDYNLNAEVKVLLYGKPKTAIAFTGNPGTTVWNLAKDFNISGLEGFFHFSGITFKGMGSYPVLIFSGVEAEIQGCVFSNVRVQYSNALNSICRFLFENNLVDAAVYIENATAAEFRGVHIAGNFFGINTPGNAGKVIYVSTYSGTALIENNVVSCSTENRGIYCNGDAALVNNSIDGMDVRLDGFRIEMTGNTIRNGLFSSSIDNFAGGKTRAHPITGNCFINTPVSVFGAANYSGNVFANDDGMTALKVQNAGCNMLTGCSTIVVGNFFVGGSIGVHLLEPDPAAENREASGAMINSNRFFGIETAIQIDSTWSGCMVTDNLIDGEIVDNGSGNIVRLNSGDPSSGGSGGGGTVGVASFKGRTGAVVPQTGDYTAAMVGAASLEQVTAAIQSAVLDSWEGSY